MKQLIIIIVAATFFFTCQKPERQILLETGSIQSIGSTTVTVTGYIIDMGDGITTYGHIAATDNSFTANVKQYSVAGPGKKGVFTSTINDLSPNTLYYVRAYANGSKETVFGKSKVSFTTLPDGSAAETFTDSRDGHVYKFVTIGNQVWMAENLAYLPAVSPSTSGSLTEPYFYVYDYDGSNISIAKATANYAMYGVLYNWPAAMNGGAGSNNNPSGVQGVCPNGWHLPSVAEWTQLTDYLGGESVAGGKLKEADFTHWLSPNEGATNERWFTALPGGDRDDLGSFSGIGYYGLWWSTTEFGATNSWRFFIGYSSEGVDSSPYGSLDYGFSVRCVKDY
jgi:uncharacterized protein (TIGR02145 family)